MEATKTDLSNRYGELLRVAMREPVIITAHGKPSHVLVSIEHWEELMQKIEDAKQGEATKPSTPRG